MLIIIVDLMV